MMRASPEQKSLVVSEILTAFVTGRYLGDDLLIRDSVLAAYMAFDAPHAFSILRGKLWQDMSVDDLMNIRSSFRYVITPPAFAYYLPAFMLASLNPEVPYDIPESTTYILSPYCPWEDPRQVAVDDFGHQTQGITQQQIAAIIVFLEYLLAWEEKAGNVGDEIQEIGIALDYWRNRLILE
jgi:hypothetical protein